MKSHEGYGNLLCVKTCGSVQHITQGSRTQANEASHIFDDQTEWTIRNDLFKKICGIFGEPEIDLFASRLKKKVSRYCSWQPVLEAFLVDSFYMIGDMKQCMLSRLSVSYIKPFRNSFMTRHGVSWLCLCGRRSHGLPCWSNYVQSPFAFWLHNWWIIFSLQRRPTPTGESTEDVGNILPGDSFRGQGLTDIVILLRSRRTTTLQAYRPHLEWWERYCIAHRVDPIMPSVGDALSFLQSLLDLETLKYSALHTARSALSSIIILADNQKFGDHPLVTRFMKGIVNLHPPTPRYISVWDPNDVLTVLKHKPSIPARKLTLLKLSMKTALLMLLTSWNRPQLLTSLDLNNIKREH